MFKLIKEFEGKKFEFDQGDFLYLLLGIGTELVHAKRVSLDDLQSMMKIVLTVLKAANEDVDFVKMEIEGSKKAAHATLLAKDEQVRMLRELLKELTDEN